MAELNDIAAGIMEHLCTHDWHGYTQGNRWGDGEYETINVCGNNYVIATGDRDCSSAVIDSWRHALVGTEYECRLDGTIYTGDMRSVFVNSGLFEWMPMSYIAQRGDVYLNELNHTAMCTCPNPDELAEFSISENGTIYGQVGDQTGWESHIRDYYDYPWNGILRYVGNANVAPSDDTYNPPSPVPELRYRVSVDPSGQNWCDEMIDHACSDGCGDDFAGILGEPIRYIAISMSGWYQVETEANGWLSPVRGYNINDLENGCAGDGSPIKKIRAYYETQNPGETGWLKIEYRAKALGGDWYDFMYDTDCVDNCGDDFAGAETYIDAFQACLVKS